MESPLCHRADLRLIETALWDGARCPLLDLHLARLSDGARALGWPLDPEHARQALTGPRGRAARLRLLLGPDGQAVVEQSAPPAPIARWRLGQAGTRLASDDPWLRIKSTHRPAYDAARQALPPDLDEVIFLNERDEICDGSITTLFFDRGEGLMTPPAHCGLLPGVLRADLLARGLCREQVLLAADLLQVSLWVGNALRGLSPAVWA